MKDSIIFRCFLHIFDGPRQSASDHHVPDHHGAWRSQPPPRKVIGITFHQQKNELRQQRHRRSAPVALALASMIAPLEAAPIALQAAEPAVAWVPVAPARSAALPPASPPHIGSAVRKDEIHSNPLTDYLVMNE